MTGLETTLTISLGAGWLTGSVFMAAWLRAERVRIDSGFCAVVALWPPLIAGAVVLGAAAGLVRAFKSKRRRR